MSLPAPNYTQAPNICFDDIFKTLKEGELRVILVLIRQTFGWHKAVDRISLGKIAEKSGIDRRSVCRSLNSLIEKGLVIKKKFGEKGKERCYFSLVIEAAIEQEKPEDDDISEEELALLSNITYQCPKVTGGSDLKSPTKETPKETIQKKQQQQAAAASFKSLEKEKQQPKITAKLHGINIPVEDKLEISRNYEPQVIDNAIDWATDPKNPPKKCLAASIKFGCKNKLTKPVPAPDIELVNKTYALKYHGQRLGNAKVEALHKTVEIDTGNSYTFFALDYTAKGFMEQFTNALRKNNFQVLPA